MWSLCAILCNYSDCRVCLGMVTAPPEDEKWYCPRCRGREVRRVDRKAMALRLEPAPLLSTASVSTPGVFRGRQGAPPGVKRKNKMKKRR